SSPCSMVATGATNRCGKPQSSPPRVTPSKSLSPATRSCNRSSTTAGCCCGSTSTASYNAARPAVGCRCKRWRTGTHPAQNRCSARNRRRQYGATLATLDTYCIGAAMDNATTLMLFRNLGTSLAIGLLVGLERGWQQRDAHEGR